MRTFLLSAVVWLTVGPAGAFAQGQLQDPTSAHREAIERQQKEQFEKELQQQSQNRLWVLSAIPVAVLVVVIAVLVGRRKQGRAGERRGPTVPFAEKAPVEAARPPEQTEESTAAVYSGAGALIVMLCGALAAGYWSLQVAGKGWLASAGFAFTGGFLGLFAGCILGWAVGFMVSLFEKR